MSSYPFFKQEVSEWLKDKFPKGSTLLDIGACDGLWTVFLRDWFVMDAIEAFRNNILQFELGKKYSNVFWGDIREFHFDQYDAILFCDVLEHMSVEDAQNVLAYILPKCKEIVVAVPYLFKQGAIGGNPYEVHIQDDLTFEKFNERYPGFQLLYGRDNYGYFIKG